MRKPQIFVSMGTPYRPEQTHFRDELMSFLRNRCDVDPKMIGVNARPPGNPLNQIKEIMKASDGVLVVAYERTFATKGYERRGADKQREFCNESYTTSWNHIESAIAFALNIPLYIVCEHGVRQEGLIDTKLDWFVLNVDINDKTIKSPDFGDSINSWLDHRVRPFAKRPKSVLAIAQKLRFSEMTGEEWAAVLAMLGAAFALGAAASRLFPSIVH